MKLSNTFGVEVAIGLVHWPVLDRAGDTVCTSITNFDVHDIARAARTYGVSKYYVINKMDEQLMFASRMMDHWKTGYGVKYNPMRSTALGMVELKPTLEEALADWGNDGLVLATAARNLGNFKNYTFGDVRAQIEDSTIKKVFIIFGTGFGLTDEAVDQCNGLLAPIQGASSDDYRHLSVRSAVSICLDRLLGT